jgi:hypothetical protein
MPTHEELEQFLREFAKLTPHQKTQFLTAVRKMVEDLRRNAGFRPSLRVKAVQGRSGVFEMTWGGSGRATFHYGAEVQPGEPNVIWRRIGGHEIFGNP